MIRVAWIAALVLVTLTVLVLLWQFSAAVVMFLISLAVAVAFRPIIEKLSQRFGKKGLALGISFGLIVLVLIAFILVITGPLIADLQRLIDDLFLGYERVLNIWQNAKSPLLVSLAAQLPPTQILSDALIGDDSSQAIEAAFGVAEGTFLFLGRLMIVITLSLYWSADHVRFERMWLSLLPVESRAQARKIWQAVETGIGAYIRREFILSVFSGLCLWAGYLLLGTHYPVLLALIGAFARLIPWFGPLLVLIFPVLAGSALGLWASLAAALYTVIILLLLEWILGTRIISRQRYSSLVLVIVMFALADSFGILGAALAPMLAVALQILFQNLLPMYTLVTNGTSDRSYTGLYAKMEYIKQMATALDSPQATETASLITRLEQLLIKSLSLEQKDLEIYSDPDKVRS